jgi:outer membrane protein assembly factor BamB
MRKQVAQFFFSGIAAVLLIETNACAGSVVWTRMTGQYPAESAPILTDIDNDGQDELIAVNWGGQVMAWRLDGSVVGDGQDGTVATLPEDRWTSSPLAIHLPEGLQFICVSSKGLVAALDSKFQPAWTYSLGANTTWARAVPIQSGDDGRIVIGHESGHATCLSHNGKPLWKVELGGPCKAPMSTATLGGKPMVLASAGNRVVAIDVNGAITWACDLGGKSGTSLTTPLVVDVNGSPVIACASGDGALCGIDASGKLLWRKPITNAIDSSITILHGEKPLILCTGLWGSLYAVDTAGSLVWSHSFETKTRTRPLVADLNNDGSIEIVVGGYNQHLYVFNAAGELIDDVRLNGTLNSSPLAVRNERGGQDVVVTGTSALLAYRLRFDRTESPYATELYPIPRTTERAKFVSIVEQDKGAALSIANPDGALLRINAFVDDANTKAKFYCGRVTSRSQIELPLPRAQAKSAVGLRILDADGRELLSQRLTIPARQQQRQDAGSGLYAWAVSPYSDFAADNLDVPEAPSMSIEIPALYGGEVGHGACAVSFRGNSASRVRATLSPLMTSDGKRLSAATQLFEVLATRATNGELVHDALSSVPSSGIVNIERGGAIKLWINVSAVSATPGTYQGKLVLQTILGEAPPVELTVTATVLSLELPKPLPLKLCTWEKVPNQWLPEHELDVHNDMSAHGVSIFWCSTKVADAKANPDGTLSIDWAKLDAELARLEGRGTILFQMIHPEITYWDGVTDAQKRAAETEFYHQMRDRLAEKGWDYDDYAFYIFDEPGLDHGKSIPAYMEAVTFFREVDPKFRIYVDPVPGLAWSDYEKLAPFIDVWAPNMRLVSGLLCKDPRIESIMKSGDPVWSYECVAQVKSLSPICYNRANAWRAFYFGLSGIGFWTYNTTQRDHWLPGEAKDEEYALTYPGSLPVSSLRWEAVRDSLQDVAALDLLRKEIARNENDPSKQVALAEAKHLLRTAVVDMMEISDPAFVETRDYLAEGDRRIWHNDLDELRLQSFRTECARLTVALEAKQ